MLLPHPCKVRPALESGDSRSLQPHNLVLVGVILLEGFFSLPVHSSLCLAFICNKVSYHTHSQTASHKPFTVREPVIFIAQTCIAEYLFTKLKKKKKGERGVDMWTWPKAQLITQQCVAHKKAAVHVPTVGLCPSCELLPIVGPYVAFLAWPHLHAQLLWPRCGSTLIVRA